MNTEASTAEVSIVDEAVRHLRPWGRVTRGQAARLVASWQRRGELSEAGVAAVLVRFRPAHRAR